MVQVGLVRIDRPLLAIRRLLLTVAEILLAGQAGLPRLVRRQSSFRNRRTVAVERRLVFVEPRLIAVGDRLPAVGKRLLEGGHPLLVPQRCRPLAPPRVVVFHRQHLPDRALPVDVIASGRAR